MIIKEVPRYKTWLDSSATSGPYYKVLNEKPEFFLNEAPYRPTFWAEGEIYVLSMDISKRYPYFEWNFKGEIIHLPDIYEVKKLTSRNWNTILIKGWCFYMGATRDKWHRISEIVFIPEGAKSPFWERKQEFLKIKECLQSLKPIKSFYYDLYLQLFQYGYLECVENLLEISTYSKRLTRPFKFFNHLFCSQDENNKIIASSFEAIIFVKNKVWIYSPHEPAISLVDGVWLVKFNPPLDP